MCSKQQRIFISNKVLQPPTHDMHGCFVISIRTVYACCALALMSLNVMSTWSPLYRVGCCPPKDVRQWMLDLYHVHIHLHEFLIWIKFKFIARGLLIQKLFLINRSSHAFSLVFLCQSPGRRLVHILGNGVNDVMHNIFEYCGIVLEILQALFIYFQFTLFVAFISILFFSPWVDILQNIIFYWCAEPKLNLSSMNSRIFVSNNVWGHRVLLRLAGSLSQAALSMSVVRMISWSGSSSDSRILACQFISSLLQIAECIQICCLRCWYFLCVDHTGWINTHEKFFYITVSLNELHMCSIQQRIFISNKVL
jgi:hypothetical protein